MYAVYQMNQVGDRCYLHICHFERIPTLSPHSAASLTSRIYDREEDVCLAFTFLSPSLSLSLPYNLTMEIILMPTSFEKT